MGRELTLKEHDKVVARLYTDRIERSGGGLVEDITDFADLIEAKKGVTRLLEQSIKFQARKKGEVIGKTIRDAVLSNPDKSYQTGKAIREKILGGE